MRHAETGYWDADGNRVPDSRMAQLTENGRAEAEAMRTFLADAQFDRVVCSGLPRTKDTALSVADGRGLNLEVVSDLEEIKAGNRMEALETGAVTPKDAVIQTAYSFWKMANEDMRYGGGESLSEFSERVLRGFRSVVAQPDWRELLLVCHGGVNRVILTDLLGGGPSMFPAFEQDSACVNVIDIDHPKGGIWPDRVVIRGVNITPADTAKHGRRLTTLEGMALKLNASLGNPLEHPDHN